MKTAASIVSLLQHFVKSFNLQNIWLSNRHRNTKCTKYILIATALGMIQLGVRLVIKWRHLVVYIVIFHFRMDIKVLYAFLIPNASEEVSLLSSQY
jgi:hypothetical protein